MINDQEDSPATQAWATGFKCKVLCYLMLIALSTFVVSCLSFAKSDDDDDDFYTRRGDEAQVPACTLLKRLPMHRK